MVSLSKPSPSKGAAIAARAADPLNVQNEGERKTVKISTVSHTLDASVAERLRHFAFRERISESAVIEFAIREFFTSGADKDLGDRLRTSGASLRRKS